MSRLVVQLLVSSRGRLFFLYGMALVLIATPAVTIRILNYTQLKQDLNILAMARRESVAVSVAQALDEQLHRIEDFTLALSTIPQVRAYVAAGNWEDRSLVSARKP